MQEILLDAYRCGARDFVIYGDDELAIIAEIALSGLKFSDIRYRRLVRVRSDNGKTKVEFMINKVGPKRKINLLAELAKRGRHI